MVALIAFVAMLVTELTVVAAATWRALPLTVNVTFEISGPLSTVPLIVWDTAGRRRTEFERDVALPWAHTTRVSAKVGMLVLTASPAPSGTTKASDPLGAPLTCRITVDGHVMVQRTADQVLWCNTRMDEAIRAGATYSRLP